MATTMASKISVELVPLGRLIAHLEPPLVLENTPSGTRYIIAVKSARFEGDRLKASAKGSAAGDWVTVSAAGIATLDVRVTLQTDDGALIYVHNNGRADLGAKGPVYSTPLFDTGDARYEWLNKIQAVARGKVSEDMSQVEYEVFELR